MTMRKYIENVIEGTVGTTASVVYIDDIPTIEPVGATDEVEQIKNPCLYCKHPVCKSPCYVQKDYYRAVSKIVQKRQKEMRQNERK